MELGEQRQAPIPLFSNSKPQVQQQRQALIRGRLPAFGTIGCRPQGSLHYTYYAYIYILHHFQKLCNRVIHNLRHSFVSILVCVGVDIFVGECFGKRVDALRLVWVVFNKQRSVGF